jgi:hypothetical protein
VHVLQNLNPRPINPARSVHASEKVLATKLHDVDTSEIAEIGPRDSEALDVAHRTKGARTVGDEEAATSAGGAGVGDVSMTAQGTMLEDVPATERAQVDQDASRASVRSTSELLVELEGLKLKLAESENEVKMLKQSVQKPELLQ